GCQLQLLPTTVRLAPTTHLEERSLPTGDELAESPLVSKSRITQIVPVSQNTLRGPRTPAFACLPTALRPSGPIQHWIFHQAEQELTTLPGLRYSSGHRKGRLKILSIEKVV